MEVHTFIPSLGRQKQGDLGLMTAWSTELQDSQGYRESLIKTNKQKRNRKNTFN